MYKMYDVYIYLFLFCIHVVVGVDDFFVLCYFSSVTSRSGLLPVVRTFYVHYYVMPETILCYLIILLHMSNLVFLVVIIVLCPFLRYMYICIQVYMHAVHDVIMDIESPATLHVYSTFPSLREEHM
jgi:hypothetical protein